VKVADANTWDVVVKVNNKVTSTQHLSVSGNTFSGTAQRVKPDGGTMPTTAVFKRSPEVPALPASGGPPK
jgi:hypothetical protein